MAISIRGWFYRCFVQARDQELLERLGKLEEQLSRLAATKQSEQCHHSVVIHRVEKIVIEKLDHSNHIDTIDIDYLSGRLNIGANYTGYLPNPANSAESGKDASAPQYHLRARK